MADQTAAIVPFHDSYDVTYDTDILNFFDHPNPNLADLSSIEEPLSDSLPLPHSSSDNIIADNIDPLEDPILWDLCNEANTRNSQAGPEIHGETFNREEENLQSEETSYANTMPLLVWPLPPVPYSCSCCLVLRELIHTNGNHTTKLEIHGRLGMICHAILENQYNAGAIPSGDNDYQMFDFCKISIENVKQFLVQYCEERKQAGYIMLQDPLSIFYEALCVGFDWDESLNTNDFIQPSPIDSGTFQMNQAETTSQTDRIHRSSLAAQRERAGKLRLKDLGNYFHLPIEEAAKKMKLCPTVVKKICRRGGMSRWPHRKIKSIKRQISNLKASLNSHDAEGRAQAQAEIERLQKELANLCAGVG